jgi:hypothetical protein
MKIFYAITTRSQIKLRAEEVVYSTFSPLKYGT